MTQDTPDLDDAFGHWFAGLADGEGCFHIKTVNAEWYICTFSIGLRLDDRAILEEIQQRTGVGEIYVIRRQHRADWTGEDHARWDVSRKHDIAQLATIFDRYPLRAKKARDLTIWREAVDVWLNLRKGSRWHGRSPASLHLAQLKAQLQHGREYIPEDATHQQPAPDPQLRLVTS